MSTNRWLNPIQNNLLYDLQGNLLASGSIAIYAAGTSTPLAVYANPDQTGSLGSTLDCDAYGLIPDFHLPENTQFKVVAYDAIGGAGGAGAVKWTRDYLYTSDKSVESRLTTLETTVNGLGTGVLNGIINGGMRTATNDVLTLTTSFLEGKVDRLFGRATNVTAGTLTQGSSVDYASGSYALFSGVSTSASAVVEGQIRIAAGEAARFVDAAAVFSCLAYQDTGSASNYTITVKTPTTTADDFSSLTTIGTSAATSVVSGTATRLEFAVADMGDCSKGIAIEISAAVGTITTKNFRLTEAQFEVGATRTSFVMTQYDVEKAAIGNGDSYVLPLAQCRLSIDGANLKLSPYAGNRINIDGTLRTIPAAGVTLGIGAAAVSTAYYIYAYYTGSAIALEFSATAYSVSSTNGMPLKTGDSTRTLVGMARTNASPAWSLVRGYYNDPGVVSSNALASSSAATASTSFIEVDSSLRTGFLVWSDETVCVDANGETTGAVSVAFDGTTAEDVCSTPTRDASSPGDSSPIGLSYKKRGLSEGYHYATMLYRKSDAYNGSVVGSATTAQRSTLQVAIERRSA